MRVSTRVVLLLALLASVLSFAKFNHCAATGWQSPDQYVHACYSDIPALYGERGLDKGVWAYSSGTDSVEYPVIQGAIMWVTAKVIPSGINNYFYVSALLLALLFIFISFITFRMKPEFGYLLPLAPAAVASLYINWDLWAIAMMMLAIYWFDRKAEVASAVALGIAISTKFLPIFLLIPIAIIFFRQEKISKFLKYAAVAVATFALINLPVALTTPEGWWRFYDLNLNRGSDWGSLWYSLSNLGLNLTHQNYLSILLLMIGLSALTIFLLQLRTPPTLAHTAIFVMIIVMAVSKVYSPQYVLWLTPLAVIALIDRRDLTVFWFWQGAEVIYHLAIWQHLAQVTGAQFGLPVVAYSVITLVRIGASLILLVRLAARHQSSRVFPSQFLLSTGESYP
ncbi:mannosyltransferase [Candidatus Planktophila dulcis]|uniref:glycosyltransferase family 87 protein n=1 Tax=Candidatus Planktophila dulcis TaxID=1884914 RepID=UPI000BACE723|nr:mannosyltransferase [Candidatus Planktophila dulcis]ASY15215.1 mannosyltransferase [Candidatus Planktophila dulcis]